MKKKKYLVIGFIVSLVIIICTIYYEDIEESIYGFLVEQEIRESHKRNNKRDNNEESVNALTRENSNSHKKRKKYGKVAKAIDLGLSVKWASWNVGASAPEEFGSYFAWGETERKRKYRSDNYIGPNSNKDGDKTIQTLNKENDAAHINWGGKWRMPTKEEFEELIGECFWKWTSCNGINGYEIKGPNGNTIFLPATGSRYDDMNPNKAGERGYYRTSSQGERDPFSLFFKDNFRYYIESTSKTDGQCVRAVRP